MRSAALYAVGIGWARGLSLIMVPILTACLAPAEFGRLELLSSAAEIGGILVCSGMLETLFRFGSSANSGGRAAGAAVVGLACAVGLAAAAVLIPFASSIASSLPLPATAAEVTMLVLSVAVEAVTTVTLGWMRLEGRPGTFVAVTVARATAQSALVAFLVLRGWGVFGIVSAGAAVAVGTAASLLVRQHRATGVAADPRRWGGFLAYSLPLIGAGLANFAMGSADRWLLAPSVGAEELGRYALAAKFAFVSVLMMQPFELWWYPKRITILSEPDGLARSARAVDAGIALAMVSAAATSALGPILIRLLTPPAYHAACAWVPWLAAAVGMQAIGNLCNVGCYVGRSTALPLAVNVTAAAVAVGGYVLLIPAMGVNGAVAATVAAQAVRMVLYLALSLPKVRVPHRWPALTLLAAATVAAASVPAVMSGPAGPVAGVLGAVFAAGVAVALRILPFPSRRRGAAHA